MNCSKHISTLEEVIEDLKSNSYSHAQEIKIENLIEVKKDLIKLKESGFNIIDIGKPSKSLRINPTKGTITEVE